MAQRNLKSIIRCSGISLLLFATSPLQACSWFENSETVRLAMFRPEMNGWAAYRPFAYSAAYYNSVFPDPEKLDQKRNCLEWQSRLGKGVDVGDVDFILYKTAPENFETAFRDKKLGTAFKGNTFVEKLILPGNEGLLGYLVFAKEMEYQNGMSDIRWEVWGDISSGSNYKFRKEYTDVVSGYLLLKDEFTAPRYAFLIMRLKYQQGLYEEALSIYDKHLKHLSNKSIILDWALLFRALCIDRLGSHVEANYLYSLAFDRCEEKKYVAMQNYNKRRGMIDSTLALAKNDHERGVILGMQLLRNPGPCLEGLKRIQLLIPESDLFNVLVRREINKLEDWIFTPMFTTYGPSVVLDVEEDEWYYEHDKAVKKNRVKDLAYLRQLRSYLLGLYKSSKGDQRDYMAVAIAHLSFMDDDQPSGRMFGESIPSNAHPSILEQKNIEQLLVGIKQQDILSDQEKEKMVKGISRLEKIAKGQFETYKSLYSLLRVASEEYKRKGDVATAGLLFLRSENYKNSYESEREGYGYYEEWYYQYDYWYLAYFDRYAELDDIDNLLLLLRKKNKTAFESYLCAQNIGDEYFYKDLKGTIAFRDNQLDLAHQTFLEIPAVYWDTAYEYRNYLNEDPFIPKTWDYVKKRNYNYKFNKAVFVKQLIDLKVVAESNTAKSAEACIKLGHAYYNCSYWGNSWMMTRYGRGRSYQENHGPTFSIFGQRPKKRKDTADDNYYNCGEAKKYYKRALEMARNNEQRAMASLMIHSCDYHEYLLTYDKYDEKAKKFKAGKELLDLYNKYQNTETFRNFNCPLLEEFVKHG